MTDALFQELILDHNRKPKNFHHGITAIAPYFNPAADEDD
jgi:hypothetical protein